jgi:WD40 repeat protein
MAPATDPDRSRDASADARRAPSSPSEVLARLRARDAGERRYELRDEIARGGMGSIVRAWDADLRRTLAMKVMLTAEERPGSSSAGATERRTARFLEEAQITGQLDHPGIVPVHELGLDAQGRLFFTMRLVKGRTLSEVFELVHSGREDWTATRALGVLLKVCEAMAFAHDKGVIHRDLKPANVMVGRFGEVYVMDWGLAKVIGREDLHDVRIAPRTSATHSVVRTDRTAIPDSPLATMDGDIVGTPCYMSPEQARGRVEDIGPHSDVYAVGSMLYHLLARHMPYCEKGEISTQSVLALLMQGPPRPLSAIDRDVPDELIAICEKAMAREPRERYPDMLGVAEDLRAYLEGRVVRAHETGPVAELKKWISRNKGFAVAASAAAALAFGGLAGVLWIQRRANAQLVAANREIESQKRAAVEQREAALRAGAELALANQALEEQKRVAIAERESAVRASAALATANASLEQMAQIQRASERAALQRGYAASIAAADASTLLFDVAAARERLESCPADLRGWEWRHLSARCDASARTLAEGGAIGALAASRGGELVAWSPSEARGAEGGAVVEVRDLRDDARAIRLDAGGGLVIALAFDPRAGRLAAVSTDRTVRVFDLAQAALAASWTERKGFAATLDFSADGARLVCAPADRSLRVVDAESGAIVRELGDRSIQVRSARYAPDGLRIAAGCREWVRVFDASSGETLVEVRDTGGQVNCVAWSPDGERVLAATGGTQSGVEIGPRSRNDDAVRVWSARTGELLSVLSGFSAGVSWAGFDASGRRVASVCDDRALRVHDLERGTVALLLGHAARPIAGALAGRGLIATAAEDASVRLWDPALSDTLVPAGHRAATPALAFLGDGRRLASVSSDGTLRVTDTTTRELVLVISGVQSYQLSSQPRIVRSLAASPRSDVIALGSNDGRLRLYDAATGAERHAIDLGQGVEAVTALAFSRDGARLAGGTSDSKVELVDPDAGTVAAKLHCGSGTIDALAFDPAGARLAIATPSELALWDLATAERVAAGPRMLGASKGLAFDRAGARLFASVGGARVEVCEVPSLKSQGSITARGELAIGVAPLDDGARIAVCGRSGRVQVWSASPPELLLSLRATDAEAEGFAVSPDGERIAVGYRDGAVRVWSSRPARDDFAERRSAERARELALGLVERMVEGGASAAEVEAHLAADETLSAPVRAAGLELARLARGTASHLRAESWQASRSPWRERADHLLALWQALELARAEPDDERGAFLEGAARYRLGEHAAAREAVRRSIEHRRYPRLQPEVPAFLALIERALGNADAAHAALVEFRALSQVPGARTADVLELARELERVFGSPASSAR